MSASAMSRSDDGLIDHAAFVGRELLAQAVPDQHGGITWNRGLDLMSRPTRDAGMFLGRVGEAYFFACLYAATKERAFERAALQASHAVRVGLQRREYAAHLVGEIGIGLIGAGSIVYALVRISQLLARPELILQARTLAQAITPSVVAEDAKLDVYWGAASAIPSLLVLHAVGCADALDRAVDCGEHLLVHRGIDTMTKRLVWTTVGPCPMVGFAHGSAGIAAALLRLYRETGERRFYEAAFEAIEFERQLYCHETLDWPVGSQQMARLASSVSWCHGAPGIVLSRLAALDVAREEDQSAIVLDLDRALTGTIGARRALNDGLCCGSFGRVDILLEAGLRLHNQSLIDVARRLAEAHAQRAHACGFVLPPPRGPGGRARDIGLWQGSAGVGYAMLRVARPDLVPCVLSLS